MKFLQADDLIEINEQMIRRTGGLFVDASRNVFNKNSLEYLVEIVQTDLVKSLDSNLAAVVATYYAFHIIKDHVFQDGNKRTGLMAAFHFLRVNGYEISELSDDELVDTALKIESEEIDRQALIDWFKSKIPASD